MEIVEELMIQIISVFKDWGELLISTISLIIAIVSLHKASKTEQIQSKINEMELKLKQYELDKIKKEQEEAALSCVEARVIKMGKGKYRLKVWNSGNTPAYDVSAKFDDTAQIIIIENEKQPFDILDVKKNYEMVLIVHNGSASKFKIITEWKDDEGKKYSKIQMGDI